MIVYSLSPLLYPSLFPLTSTLSQSLSLPPTLSQLLDRERKSDAISQDFLQLSGSRESSPLFWIFPGSSAARVSRVNDTSHIYKYACMYSPVSPGLHLLRP